MLLFSYSRPWIYFHKCQIPWSGKRVRPTAFVFYRPLRRPFGRNQNWSIHQSIGRKMQPRPRCRCQWVELKQIPEGQNLVICPDNVDSYTLRVASIMYPNPKAKKTEKTCSSWCVYFLFFWMYVMCQSDKGVRGRDRERILLHCWCLLFCVSFLAYLSRGYCAFLSDAGRHTDAKEELFLIPDSK